MDFNYHVAFVFICVVFLIICYIFRRRSYQPLLILGIASTLLVYITDTKTLFYILGIEEFVILFMIIAQMMQYSKEEKAALEKGNEEQDTTAQEDTATATEEKEEKVQTKSKKNHKAQHYADSKDK